MKDLVEFIGFFKLICVFVTVYAVCLPYMRAPFPEGIAALVFFFVLFFGTDV